MDTEYPPTAATEPWSFGEAVALIVATADDENLPFPRSLIDNIPGNYLIVLQFDSAEQARAWVRFFAIDVHKASGHGVYCGRSNAWHGWTVLLEFDRQQVSGSGGIEPSSPPSDPVVTQPTPGVCVLAGVQQVYDTPPCDGPVVWQLDYFTVAGGERQPIRQVHPVCYRHAYHEVRWVTLRKRPEQVEMRVMARHAAAAVLTPDATL